MSSTNTITRSLSDVGLATWFGGTLANAVALNRGAGSTDSDTAEAVNAGWKAWTPINLAAIGMHLVCSTSVLLANKGRLVGQKGVASGSVVRGGVLLAALDATAYSRVVGQRMIDNPPENIVDGTTPAADTDPTVAQAQRQLDVLQWVVPALTGTLLVLNAYQGEQQRPMAVARGLLDRVIGS